MSQAMDNGTTDGGVRGKKKHDHDHDHGGKGAGAMECCAHHELSGERWIMLSMVGGLLVFISTLCRWLDIGSEEISQVPALIGAIFLGSRLVYAAYREIMRGQAGSSTLAAIAIIAAIAINKYEAAGYLAFILLVFDQALRRTAWGARRAIEDLVQLTPDIARVVEAGVEREAGLASVTVGMTVRVRPGENLPVDGVVSEGRSMINQASLTGEAVPVEVEPGSLVYAGTTNLTGNIDLQVTGVGGDTTIGKVAELISEAESTRTPRQAMIEQVARYFVPVALVVSGLVWYLTQDVETAITVLVVTCPSALLISSPTAMMASFAAAARLGILIKQTQYLEAAANVDTIVFDKTGTLTTGRFAVSRLSPAEGVEGAELLQAAADAEQHSNHPLAKSIMKTAEAARIQPASTSEYEEVHGHGVRSRGPGSDLLAGRSSWLREINAGIAGQVELVESRIEGMSGVHVMRDGRYLGAVGLEDKLRYNARAVVEKVRDLGVRRLLVFTGDRLAVAKRVGAAVGVDAVEAECLPEEKHSLVTTLSEQGRHVLMVGDGINDGPSLAAADVGVAMGLHGSAIATNSAGIALMNDDLSRIPFLILLARRTRLIIAQNIAISIIIALIGLIVAATGAINIGIAAFYHFFGDICVLGNSFRLIRFGEDFAAQEKYAASSAAKEATQRQVSGGRAGSATIQRPATGAA